MKTFLFIILALLFIGNISTADELNPNPPAQTARLVFIHHSTGEGWLSIGNLREELNNNNYYVTDTNYGWGPDSIGDLTDIGDWYNWFLGPNRDTYMQELYSNTYITDVIGENTISDPGGSNSIIMFKSCFPNGQNISGNPGDPPLAKGLANPICGECAGSDSYTVSNIKGMYRDILDYFATRQDKLFILITTPPSLYDITATSAANNRAISSWLVDGWLNSYAYNNVFAFDYYNVLTSNGGNPNTNDLNAVTGNHHRFKDGAIQHVIGSNNNYHAYAVGGDNHPTAAGQQKATGEFLPLLNIAYNRQNIASITIITPIGAVNANQNVTVTVDIVLPANVANAKLYYMQGGKITYQNLSFSLQSGNLNNGRWTATIPANQVTTKGIAYYVDVTDINGSKYYNGAASNPKCIPVHGNTSITTHTTPLGSPNVWNVIAPSVTPDNKLVSNTFQSFGTFGQAWIAWRWNTTAHRWEAPQTFGSNPVSSDQFDIAKSWWFAVDGDGSTTPVTVTGTSVDCTKPYEITLNTGWNSVANPFAFPVAWSDINISVWYSSQSVCPTEAESNGWVDNRCIWYDTAQGEYVTQYSYDLPAYVIPPNQGFWLYSAVNGANLVIQPVELPSPAPPAYAVQRESGSWGVVLSVQSDIGKDSVEAVVGDRIESGSIRLSHIKPPALPFTAPRISFIQSEDSRTELSCDAKSQAEEIVWTLEAESPSAAYLGWDLHQVPEDYNIILEDSVTGQVVDLKREKNYVISGGVQHHFVLRAYYHTVPKATKLLSNYPNPFNPETWIPFELSQDTEVSIRIYTATGQLVRTLELGHKAAGFYTEKTKAACWDGKNEAGEKVSSGVYFYSIKAGDYTSTHKMVILK